MHIRILHDKNYEDWFKLLYTAEEKPRIFFETRGIYLISRADSRASLSCLICHIIFIHFINQYEYDI